MPPSNESKTRQELIEQAPIKAGWDGRDVERK